MENPYNQVIEYYHCQEIGHKFNVCRRCGVHICEAEESELEVRQESEREAELLFRWPCLANSENCQPHHRQLR